MKIFKVFCANPLRSYDLSFRPVLPNFRFLANMWIIDIFVFFKKSHFRYRCSTISRFLGDNRVLNPEIVHFLTTGGIAFSIFGYLRN